MRRRWKPANEPIAWKESQSPSAVNDSIRAQLSSLGPAMKALKRKGGRPKGSRNRPK